MIGSAIFSLSGLTIYKAGPAALITWVIAAVIMLAVWPCSCRIINNFPKIRGCICFPKKNICEE